MCRNTRYDMNCNNNTLTVIDRCQVAPPPGSVPATTLPLTFFDIPWSCCLVPVQRIFFYEFHHPTNHFLQTALPTLKHSLSLTLQHFFPFAANLIVPPQPHLSHFRYLPGDSLPFTVAESTADFPLLTSDSPQDVRNWHPLVPTLPSPRVEPDGTRAFPLMAIQVTVLPNSGFTISLTFNHLAGDGKSLHHFIKFWASLCKARGDTPLSLPSHERDKVKDPKGLKLLYLQELENHDSNMMEIASVAPHVFVNKVRSTFILSREQVERLKKWVSLKYCATNDSGASPHISTFVVTCSLVWVCMIRSEESKGNSDGELCYVVFLADCRDSPEFSLPSTYFGNCLASCIVGMKRSVVVGENGIVEVAKAIERRVRDLKSDVLTRAETLMSDFGELWKPGKSVVVVAGSPKLTMYQTDFGWGKPKKTDAVHIDAGKMISLSDCRDKDGGIEVGLALDKSQMNNFNNILEEQLNITVCE